MRPFRERLALLTSPTGPARAEAEVAAWARERGDPSTPVVAWPYTPRDALRAARCSPDFASQPGGLAVRQAPLELDALAGRFPLGAALSADTLLLSLLSLTPSLSCLDLRRALYLDIETTGLGGAGTIAFLVGLCYFDGERFVLEQLFLRDPDDESDMLARVIELVEKSALVVSYNGKSFDLPQLRSRLRLHKNLGELPERPMLDLLHLARRVHRSRSFPKTLRTVECEILGLERGPDVGGEEIAQRYHHYLRTRDIEPIVPVVQHNAADVIAMVGLVGLYGAPLDGLSDAEVVDAARVFRRAGALERAEAAVAMVIDRSGAPEARRVRAEIARARGDLATALSELETLLSDVDDGGARLALAKIYEHRIRAPARALALVEQGTTELPSCAEHRRQRLVRKVSRRTT